VVKKMKKMKRAAIPVMALVFVAIWVVLAGGTTAVWVTGELRAFGLVALLIASVASLLIAYFDWREKLRRRVLADSNDYRKAA
jgi:hypothetical protein